MNNGYIRKLRNYCRFIGAVYFAFVVITQSAFAYNKVPASYQDEPVAWVGWNCRLFSDKNHLQGQWRDYNFEGTAEAGNRFRAWCKGGKAVHGDDFYMGRLTGDGNSIKGDYYYCPPIGNDGYVVGPDADNMCTDPYAKPPPPVTCDSSEVNKEVQFAKYACDLGNPSSAYYDTVFNWSCADVVGQQFPNLNTSCAYEPNGCIVGLNCEGGNPDLDKPICNPENDECEIPPETEDEVEPSDPPDINPDDALDFCKLHPDLCEDPAGGGSGGGGSGGDGGKPDVPDIPKPEPDPDLSDGDNAIVGELVVSNEHFKQMRNDFLEFSKESEDAMTLANKLAQHQLGALKKLVEKPTGGGGGGDGGIANVETAVQEGNDLLEEIACSLDEDCEEGGNKPSANIDCETNTFDCKGDVLQCKALELSYRESCVKEELSELEKAIQGMELDSEEYLVDSESLDLSAIDDKYLNDGVSLGQGSCPAPITVNLDGQTVTFSYEPLCYYANLIRPWLIAFAWITGLLIIGRSQGAF